MLGSDVVVHGRSDTLRTASDYRLGSSRYRMIQKSNSFEVAVEPAGARKSSLSALNEAPSGVGFFEMNRSARASRRNCVRNAG